MTAPFQSQARNFGELLGTYGKPLVVPQFQRGYSWENREIATFWDDLISFHKQKQPGNVVGSYFMGPIVLLPERDGCFVLDGQQRLATVTILLSVMRNLARELGTNEGSDFARDLQRDLIEKEEGGHALALGELDADFYRQSIQYDPPTVPEPSLRSQHLIEGARKYVGKHLQQEVNGSKPRDVVKFLRNLRSTLTKHVIVVAISVESEEEAFLIFETLNDRGLRLSVPDLLLNYLMRTARSKQEKKRIRQYWNNILENMGRRDVARFLRHMWLSKYGDVKARGLFREIKRTIDAKGVSRVNFAESCADECELYTALLDVNVRQLGKDACAFAEGIVRYLNAHPTLPLLLAGLSCLSKQDFAKLARMAVSLVVRHSVIANQNPADLETALYQAARQLRKSYKKTRRGATTLSKVRNLLREVDPGSTVVENAVDELYLTKNQAKYMLAALGNAMQSRTKEIGIDSFSLEHIYPLNPSSAWTNQRAMEPLKWHIGNLTLLGKKLNTDAANRAFREKVRTYYTRSEIEMTRTIAATYREWTPDAIKARARNLAKVVLRVWPAP